MHTTHLARRALVIALSGVALAACGDSVLEPTASTRTLLAPSAPSRALALMATAPALPQFSVPTAFVAPTGRKWFVAAGGNLQAALDSAQGGDIVALQPGATFTGNFILKNKGNTADVVVQTDNAANPANVRVTPATAAGFAKIVTPNGMPALQTTNFAQHWRVQMVEITAASSVTMINALVTLGDGHSTQNTLTLVPSYLVLDRVYIHGSPTMDLRRTVMLNSAWSAIINSYLSEAHSAGGDAQAIFGYNGPGPYKIQNNYLEGSTENIMFGGADPYIKNMIPSDIEIIGNYLTKPIAWKGKWLVKNTFELKFAQRVLVEGNVIENSWVAAQAGYALNIKTSTDAAAQWVVTQDVTIRYNIIRNAAGGISLAAKPDGYGVPAQRISVVHNLLYNIGTFNGTTTARMFMTLDSLTDVTIAHNTAIPNNANTLVAMDGLKDGVHFSIADNILVRGTYGVKGAGTAEGTASFTGFWKSYQMTSNGVVGLVASLYPAGNLNTASTSTIGFVDLANGDYHLTAASPFYKKASDGTDLGADIDMVNAKTAMAINGY